MVACSFTAGTAGGRGRTPTFHQSARSAPTNSSVLLCLDVCLWACLPRQIDASDLRPVHYKNKKSSN